VPGAKTSGGTSRHRRTKDGNRSLTRAFRHAAVRAIPYDPEIQAWDRQRLRTKGAMIARALVATALARIVYHVLAKQADFNGRFKGTTLSRTKTLPWPASGPSRTPSPAASLAPACPARGATTVAYDWDGIRHAVDHRWDYPRGRARTGCMDAAAHVRCREADRLAAVIVRLHHRLPDQARPHRVELGHAPLRRNSLMALGGARTRRYPGSASRGGPARSARCAASSSGVSSRSATRSATRSPTSVPAAGGTGISPRRARSARSRPGAARATRHSAPATRGAPAPGRGQV